MSWFEAKVAKKDSGGNFFDPKSELELAVFRPKFGRFRKNSENSTGRLRRRITVAKKSGKVSEMTVKSINLNNLR